MTVEQIDNTRLIIALCDEDMKNFSLNYDTLCLKDPHSNKILKQLLLLAEIKTGIEIHNKKIMVEAMNFENGCILLVTLSLRENLKYRRYKIKTVPYIFIAEFKNIETLFLCIEKLRDKSLYIPPSWLYVFNGKYELIFVSKITLRQRLHHLLTEFCDYFTDDIVFRDRICEYGTKICGTNTVQKIIEALASHC